MEKLVLLSVLLVNMALAGRAGGRERAGFSYYRAWLSAAFFNVFYVVILLYVYPRISG